MSTRRESEVISNVSDFYLVTAALKIKLRMNRPGKPRQKVWLRNDVGKHKKVLSFYIWGIGSNPSYMETIKINTHSHTQARGICFGRRQQKEWISPETWKAVENRILKKTVLEIRVLEAKFERLKESNNQEYRKLTKQWRRRSEKTSKITSIEDRGGNHQWRARKSIYCMIRSQPQSCCGKFQGSTMAAIEIAGHR